MKATIDDTRASGPVNAMVQTTQVEQTDDAPTLEEGSSADVTVHFPRKKHRSRFPLWYALTVFSAVTVIALTTETDTTTWEVEEQWILSVTLLSLLVSCVACLAHIAVRPKFVGMPAEGFLVST
jgi:hypothetical protein